MELIPRIKSVWKNSRDSLKADAANLTARLQKNQFHRTSDGDISQDSVALQGNVFIAYSQMVMNRGESASLTLDRASGKGKWSGPGQALFLDEPLDVSPDHRIERPEIQPPAEDEVGTVISMRANWNSSMNLDQLYGTSTG